MNFGRIKRQIIEGDFDGGTLSSDGGLLLLKTTNLPKDIDATSCYDDIYCARGEAENRIKETQLDLFGTRTSASLFKSNYLRVTRTTIS